MVYYRYRNARNLGGEAAFMTIPRINLLRWLRQILLLITSLWILFMVVLRFWRRIHPQPMPARFTPVLTAPWRSWLFGTPEQVLDRAGIEPGMRVLEIGPGPGVYTTSLARRVGAQGKEGSVTCVEIQPEMIAMLQDRLQSAEVRNVEVIQGDGRHIPLADNSFNLVVLASVVGETPNLSALFSECARVLKPGGALSVTEYIVDPDFRLPRTIRKLATDAGLIEAGEVGLPWWGYTAQYHKLTNSL